jgi:hypothetical protein
MSPLPNQTSLWHGIGSQDLPNQQDLFDCDLATRPPTVWVDATETPDWAKAVLGNGDGEEVDDRS